MKFLDPAQVFIVLFSLTIRRNVMMNLSDVHSSFGMSVLTPCEHR